MSDFWEYIYENIEDIDVPDKDAIKRLESGNLFADVSTVVYQKITEKFRNLRLNMTLIIRPNFICFSPSLSSLPSAMHTVSPIVIERHMIILSSLDTSRGGKEHIDYLHSLVQKERLPKGWIVVKYIPPNIHGIDDIRDKITLIKETDTCIRAYIKQSYGANDMIKINSCLEDYIGEELFLKKPIEIYISSSFVVQTTFSVTSLPRELWLTKKCEICYLREDIQEFMGKELCIHCRTLAPQFVHSGLV